MGWRALRAAPALVDRMARLLWGGGVDRDRRSTAAGVLWLLALTALLGALHALATPPFGPPDETSHVAYALAVSEGRIPHIAELPPQLPIPGMREGLSVWTANHPPGAALVLAVPLRVGIAVGQPLAGFYAARLTSVLAVAAAVALVARIAATVVPHRPRMVVVATMVGALPPYSVQVAGTAYTDGIALLGSTALLAATVDVLVRGPSRRRLAALLLLAAVGALMRAPTAVLIVLAGAAWALSQLVHGTGRLRTRLRRGLLGAAAVGGVAFAAGGWFYLGNVARYGDPTGARALFDLHQRLPRQPLVELLLQGHDYRYHAYQLWSRYEGLPPQDRPLMPEGFLAANELVLAAALLSAALVAAHHLLRRRGDLDVGRVAAWGLLVGWWLALFVMMLQFVSGGGAPHARYLWPGAAGFGLVLAAGLESWRLPAGSWRRLRWPTLPLGALLALGALVWGNAYSLPEFLRRIDVLPTRLDLLGTIDVVLGRVGVRGAGAMAVLGCAALAAAVVGVAVALLTAPTRSVDPG